MHLATSQPVSTCTSLHKGGIAHHKKARCVLLKPRLTNEGQMRKVASEVTSEMMRCTCQEHDILT